jgi:hypothetical protein
MDGLLNALKLVHEMSVDIIEFAVAVQNWFVRCGVCNVTAFTIVLESKK